MRSGRAPCGWVSKLMRNTMGDVIQEAGVHAYYCGHQHLMATFAPCPPKRAQCTAHQPANTQYHIIGNSSKIEQDDEDYSSCFPCLYQESAKELGVSKVTLGARFCAFLENKIGCCMLGSQRDKIARRCRRHWFEQELGFAFVKATPTELQTTFFRVVVADPTKDTPSPEFTALPVASHVQKVTEDCDSISIDITLHRRRPVWDSDQEQWSWGDWEVCADSGDTFCWEKCNMVPAHVASFEKESMKASSLRCSTVSPLELEKALSSDKFLALSL